MNALLLLIPVALGLGLLGLLGFLWAMKSGQFDDMEGAANRILFDDDDVTTGPGQARDEELRRGGPPDDRQRGSGEAA